MYRAKCYFKIGFWPHMGGLGSWQSGKDTNASKSQDAKGVGSNPVLDSKFCEFCLPMFTGSPKFVFWRKIYQQTSLLSYACFQLFHMV